MSRSRAEMEYHVAFGNIIAGYGVLRVGFVGTCTRIKAQDFFGFTKFFESPVTLQSSTQKLGVYHPCSSLDLDYPWPNFHQHLSMAIFNGF